MNETTQNQLIADLARDVVIEIAPHELPMFRLQSEAYFKDPDSALEGHAGKEDMLGFGAGAAAAFLTPAVLAVTTAVVKFAAEEAKKSVQDEGADLISDIVKRMFKKFRPEEKKEGEGRKDESKKDESKKDESKKDKGKEGPLPLTPEQLKKVRELAFEQALQLRLSENTAETLAESLVGSLVVDF